GGHALGCGLEHRGKARLYSKTDIGGAAGAFAERLARQHAEAGAASAAPTVYPQEKHVHEGVHFRCSLKPPRYENKFGSKCVLPRRSVLRELWILSAPARDIPILTCGSPWISPRR